MSISQVAEALYTAHQQRATGQLTLDAGGKQSQLLLEGGDLVGARIGFGYQSPAQALVAAGKMSLSTLDTLWARGEAALPDEEILQAHQTPREEASLLQALAWVRSLTALTRRVRFQPGKVEPMFERVSGVRMVRAAFEAGVEPEVEPKVFRCADPASCSAWVLSDEERSFLEGLSSFQRPQAGSSATLGLLRLLEHEGRVEARAEQQWQAEELERQQREEAARLEAERAEETRRREEERRVRERALEEARRREEARLAAERAAQEARRQEEARRAAEEARLQEEAAQRAAEEARLQEEAAQRAAEEARLQEEARRAAEEAAVAADALEEVYEPEMLLSTEDVVEEPAAAAPSLEPAMPLDAFDEPAHPALPEYGASQPAPAAPPEQDAWVMTELRPDAQASTFAGGEEDLWRIVGQQQPPPASMESSFQAALGQVDAQLERLVGVGLGERGPVGPVSEPPVEIVEATIEPVAGQDAMPAGWMPSDNPAGTMDTLEGAADPGLEEAWPFDENDVAGDPSDPAEVARLRRQRLLRRAMENMGALTPARASTPAAPQQGSAPRPPDEAPRADEQQLATLIETRFQEISTGGKDHFALLGVSRQATRDQVRQAFLGLAKVFHPDRLPPSLSHLAPKITAVFEAVRDAYDVLMDDGKRTAYLMSLEKPTAAAKADFRAATEAIEHFKRGEVYFKKRDYLAAEASYERAYALDPKATYMAAKAWTIYMDPARKADAGLAKQMMLDAVKQEPSCDRAHYQLGVIARVENDPDRAERHFREAIRANPKHLEANQELRLIEMRRRGPPPKKGFFR